MSTLLAMIEPDVLDQITPAQQSNLFRKLEAIALVERAGYGRTGMVQKQVAEQMHVSPQAVQNWRDQYKAKGCHALIDGRRKRGAQRGLSDTTKQWIFEEFCRMQREDSGTEIYKMIRERARLWWRTGNPRYAIPGFLDCPQLTAKGYPDGLSAETIRRYGPDAYQRTLAHQGKKSASALLPSIPMTRVGVEYLERVFFDDQMYDHYITEHGHAKPMRPVGFNSLDFLTGVFLDFHIRLRWWDTEDKIHRGLTQREYTWFVLRHLSEHGYRTDHRGTRLVFEHGTANSWHSDAGLHRTPDGLLSFDDAIFAHTDEHVTIDRSGKFNQATWKELLFVPKSAGNFRYKSPIESMFRAVRTHGLHLLTSPTGKDAEHAPEDSYGMEREERRWLKLANQFPPHLAEAVRSNNYSFWEYYKAYRLIYDVINADPEHALKDWDKLNFILREWHWNTDPPDMWRPRSELASLDDNRRASFDVQLAADQSLLRPRRMSRGEAQRVCASDPCIKRLSKWKFHKLLPMDWAFPVKVRDNREIVIHDPLLQGAGDLTYMTTCRNERGHVIHLQPGDNLLCHLDPFRPDELVVLDQGGMIIGMTPRRPDYVPCNSELAHELLGSRARMEADIGAPVRAALQPLAKRRAEVRECNEALEERMRDVSPRSTGSGPAASTGTKPERKRGGSGDVDPLASSVQARCSDEPEADPFD